MHDIQNISVFLQRIKQKEEMENKKPIVLNNLEEWDFTDYIDSLIQKEEAVDLEFKIAKDGLPNSLWDTYSSFANTDGGVIILGVKEYKQQFIIEGLTKEYYKRVKKEITDTNEVIKRGVMKGANVKRIPDFQASQENK